MTATEFALLSYTRASYYTILLPAFNIILSELIYIPNLVILAEELKRYNCLIPRHFSPDEAPR